MRWIEASVETHSGDIDEKCEKLAELGVPGMVIEDEADFRAFLENNRQYWDYVDDELERHFAGVSRIKFYLSDDADGLEVLRRVRAGGEDVTVSYIEDSDWENNWREFYRPIEVGEKLVVVPEWESCTDTERLPLRLDPGLIFGTGSHATTRMCLMALEKLIHGGERVLDLGCGTGLSTLVWDGRCRQVIGVEPSEDMLAIARQKTRPGLSFVRAFAHQTGLPDGCADAALPWRYRQKVEDFLKPQSRILDMAPGDGAFLLALRHPFAQTSVAESRPAALHRCEKKLAPLGIAVRQSAGTQAVTRAMSAPSPARRARNSPAPGLRGT